MVARLDQLERKQFRVVDQLDPDGRQHDGGTELAVQALCEEAFVCVVRVESALAERMFRR